MQALLQQGFKPRVITELMEGDLTDFVEPQTARLDQCEIIDILQQINSALAVLHKGSILHRNLKLESIYHKRIGNRKIIKVAGFRLAKRMANVQSVPEKTLFYQSPELLWNSVGTDYTGDLWSLGIIIYVLVQGIYVHPYIPVSCFCYNSDNEDNRQIIKNWLMRNKYRGISTNKCSAELAKLLEAILNVNPNKRISWDEYKTNSLFKCNF